MIFAFSKDAGKEKLELKGEEFKYLIKVRRHQVGEVLFFRNPHNPSTLYSYEIEAIYPKKAYLKLVSSQEKIVMPQKKLHLGWCVIDPKSIEKALPALNEIGVSKISFIFCDRSQKNFKIDYNRLRRILEASMQQCGRSEFMKFCEYSSLQVFLDANPQTALFDFGGKALRNMDEIATILIGCEGGFSTEEKELLANQPTFSFDTPLVLRSESAAIAAASKILL